MDLSHSFIALRPSGTGAWAQNFSCTGRDVHYDPSLCLEVLGFGGTVFSVNIHPPYIGDLRMAGRSLGDVSQAAPSSYYDVLHGYGMHHFETVSIEHLFHRLRYGLAPGTRTITGSFLFASCNSQLLCH